MQKMIIVIIAIVSLVLVQNAHADSITTDQSNYKYGDTIQVYASFSNTAVIKILNPNGDIVYVIQAKPSADFEKNVLVMGSAWNQNGTYTIQMIDGGIESDDTFGINAQDQSVSIVPSFGFSSATTTSNMPTFQESNATTLSFSESNATNSLSIQDVQNAKVIPVWVKSIFIAYGNDQISEQELINAIKFLISTGVIVLN